MITCACRAFLCDYMMAVASCDDQLVGEQNVQTDSLRFPADQSVLFEHEFSEVTEGNSVYSEDLGSTELDMDEFTSVVAQV